MKDDPDLLRKPRRSKARRRARRQRGARHARLQQGRRRRRKRRAECDVAEVIEGMVSMLYQHPAVCG
ncbi:MAG: hypothetical protein R3F11_14540 [Verrucomicrobiales bacterium]